MPNRVLMLLENEPYPDDARVFREATTLTEVGYQVAIICPAEKGQRRHEDVAGVQVYRYAAPREGDRLLGYLWEYGYSLMASFLLSLVVKMRHGFDVIHAHNPPDLFVLIAIFYRLTGTRFIFDHHDLCPEMYHARLKGEGNRLVSAVLLAFEKLSCRMADHIIATNESYKNVEIERGKVPEERITVVRNGPDLDNFHLVAPDLNIKEKAQTIIGYVGVMGLQDGIDYLLRTLRHLIDDMHQTDFLCVLIGDGPAKQQLERLTSELGLQNHVLFTGCLWDEDLLRCLSTADICVVPDPSNPYNDRSTMIKIMEYMALEKPIVAFDMPEHRESAQDSALYANANDEVDFARQLARLIDDPQLRVQLGTIGAKRVKEHLAWNFQAARLVEAYRKVGLAAS